MPAGSKPSDRGNDAEALATHTAMILEVIKETRTSLETQIAAMAAEVGLRARGLQKTGRPCKINTGCSGDDATVGKGSRTMGLGNGKGDDTTMCQTGRRRRRLGNGLNWTKVEVEADWEKPARKWRTGKKRSITTLNPEQMKVAQVKAVLEMKHNRDILSNNKWRALVKEGDSCGSDHTETEHISDEEHLPVVTSMTADQLG
ncbi:hypothetical protein NDU88_005043 [Pleurodeles waltl]|uniref:Uncharacterized protein n=1 Tax=Pleurodeles waltl TaxID=8319 RepID=A0AAV7PE83_PLEWA|nr:hypothetical protein NDU88_005043 [Pleurodeles waltl]